MSHMLHLVCSTSVWSPSITFKADAREHAHVISGAWMCYRNRDVSQKWLPFPVDRCTHSASTFQNPLTPLAFRAPGLFWLMTRSFSSLLASINLLKMFVQNNWTFGRGEKLKMSGSFFYFEHNSNNMLIC